jgi:hypothetical protein
MKYGTMNSAIMNPGTTSQSRAAMKIVRIRSLPREALRWDDRRLAIACWGYWLAIGKRLYNRTTAPDELADRLRRTVIALDTHTSNPGVIAIARALRLTGEGRLRDAAPLWRQMIEEQTFVDDLKRMAEEIMTLRRAKAEIRNGAPRADQGQRTAHFMHAAGLRAHSSLSRQGKPATKSTFLSEMIAVLGSDRKAFEQGQEVDWPWVSAEGKSQACPRAVLFEFVESQFNLPARLARS